jgi:hypothetical protein
MPRSIWCLGLVALFGTLLALSTTDEVTAQGPNKQPGGNKNAPNQANMNLPTINLQQMLQQLQQMQQPQGKQGGAVVGGAQMAQLAALIKEVHVLERLVTELLAQHGGHHQDKGGFAKGGFEKGKGKGKDKGKGKA